MMPFGFSRRALSAALIVGVLWSCGGTQALQVGNAAYSSSSFPEEPPGVYTILYSFHGQADGRFPQAPPIVSNGTLYGTTSAGGTRCLGTGCGTIYSVSPSGTEKVLYRFEGAPDGADPLTEITALKQQLYGTTYLGGVSCGKKPKGNSGCGTIFSITPSGTERVLHRFGHIPDGTHPDGPLTNVNGRLYGTTSLGGAKCAQNRLGCGTVFSVDPSGKESVLYRFTGSPDGAEPTGNLVFLGGKLYGTTLFGGPCNAGTVFEVTLSGRERVLYSASCTLRNIESPTGLVAVGGVLYGSSNYHYGGIYAVTTGGKMRILHTFGQAWNGHNPSGSLATLNGMLYGTTAVGGLGYGVVYGLSTSGRLFHVIYRFKGSPDGAFPEGGSAEVKGALYGTTSYGGSGCHYQYCQNGFGTIFRISP